MVKPTHAAGRTAVVAAGGRQISARVYSTLWTVAVGVSIGLTLAAPNLGPLAIPVALVLALSVAALRAPSMTRRLIDAQAAQWPTLDEQIAFERVAYRKATASAAYEPPPWVVERELKKCRLALMALTCAVVVVTCSVVFLRSDDDPRMLLIAWSVVAFGYSLFHIVHRILALRLLWAAVRGS